MIKHILFDNDGTLVDSEIIAVRAMLKHLAAHGLVIDEKTYSLRYPGLRERDILAALRVEFDLHLPDDLLKAVKAESAQTFRESLRSIRGMPTIFRKVTVPRSVVSNGSVRHVEISLRKVRLRKALDGHIFSAEHVENPKPAPDLYRLALDTLRLEPEQVLVIEDSPTGVQAAKTAGLTVVGFLGAAHIHEGHDDRLRQLGVDYLATDAKELSALLEKWRVL
ncbi:MAG: HAD-IA family hydrolase [Saprospiraceae bacterium]|nr:HAD-IA family hydrolase [Saprospiraceae bacterium]